MSKLSLEEHRKVKVIYCQKHSVHIGVKDNMKRHMVVILICCILFMSCTQMDTHMVASSTNVVVVATVQPTATPVPQLSFDDFLSEALLYYAAGNYEEAILSFVMALEIEPKNFDALFGLGKSYGNTYQTAKAIETLEAALQVRTDSAEAAVALGYAYLNSGDPVKAGALARPLWEGVVPNLEAGVVLLLSLAAEERIEDILDLLSDEDLAAYIQDEANDADLYAGQRNAVGMREGRGVCLYNRGYIYIGDYKADVRSGQGTWMRVGADWVFMGAWADDAPNGYGEYYLDRTPPIERQEGTTYAIHVEEKANYVEGLVHGTIHVSWLMDSGKTHIWDYAVTNGVAGDGIVAYCEECGADLSVGGMHGVMPWTE